MSDIEKALLIEDETDCLAHFKAERDKIDIKCKCGKTDFS